MLVNRVVVLLEANLISRWVRLIGAATQSRGTLESQPLNERRRPGLSPNMYLVDYRL